MFLRSETLGTHPIYLFFFLLLIHSSSTLNLTTTLRISIVSAQIGHVHTHSPILHKPFCSRCRIRTCSRSVWTHHYISFVVKYLEIDQTTIKETLSERLHPQQTLFTCERLYPSQETIYLRLPVCWSVGRRFSSPWCCRWRGGRSDTVSPVRTCTHDTPPVRHDTGSMTRQTLPPG